MNNNLHLLKSCFLPFAPLWEAWMKFPENNLAGEEIYTLQVHIMNDFKSTLNDGLMFYNKPSFLFNLSQKLDASYPAFQEWVISGFFYKLIKIAIKYDYMKFIETPIPRLKIELPLKESLIQFKQDTIQDIINTYSEEHLKDPVLFKIILDFMEFNPRPQLAGR